ncbi:MAG: hypothetical protein E6Q50_05950 [Lysobacter sp.]|nr:MAG: hypothetical protein E6Q50_05950 [Lysobacter sp.]
MIRFAQRVAQHVTIAAVVIAFAGCATKSSPKPPAPPVERRTGEVSESIVESDAASRYVIEPGQTYESPVVLGEYSLPEYPADRLADRLPPIEIVVRVVVGSEGLVERVDPLGETNDGNRAFYDATKDALMRWEFSPFRIKDEATSIVRDLPFHQDYRFVFRQIDGKPLVEKK